MRIEHREFIPKLSHYTIAQYIKYLDSIVVCGTPAFQVHTSLAIVYTMQLVRYQY